MPYVVDPTVSQDSVTTFLRAQYSSVPVPIIPGGLVDQDDNKILKFTDASIKPFAILWFGNAAHSTSHRGFANAKLDSYHAGMDLVVVARNDDEARKLINDMSNRLIDYIPANSGRITTGSSLWSDGRAVIDDQNRPSRWARTNRFSWGINHTFVT